MCWGWPKICNLAKSGQNASLWSQNWVICSVPYRILSKYKVFMSICKKPHAREKSCSRIISIIMSKLAQNRSFGPFSRDWDLGSVRYRILCKYKMGRSICKRIQVPEKSQICIISIIRRQNMSKIETFRLLRNFSSIWVIGSVGYHIFCKYKLGRSIYKIIQVPEKS